MHKNKHSALKRKYIYNTLLGLITFLLLSQIGFAQPPKETLYLTMHDAIDRALGKNNQIRASEFSLQKAKWDKINAWTMLFPRVTFSTRYTWIDDSSFALRDFSRYFRSDDSQPPAGFPMGQDTLAGPSFNIPQTVWQETYATSFGKKNVM